MGKEDWLLGITSKILQRDQNKSLKKEERGSQGPPPVVTLEQGSQAEPCSRTAAWVLGTLTSHRVALSKPLSLARAACSPQPCSRVAGLPWPGCRGGPGPEGRWAPPEALCSRKAPRYSGLTDTASGAAASSPCPRLQPRARGPSSSNSFALVCRCRGCGDGVFQVGDGGPEAVAANPLEYPGGWQRPGDLCRPHRLSGRGSPSLPRPHPTPPLPVPAPRPLRILQGDTSGAVTIGLKGRTHDWLREETFLFLNLDQRKPFYF